MNEERAAAGVDHLQTAALEMISAMRAFLDVAEEVVSSNEHLEDLTRVVGSVAQGVSRATGFNTQGAEGSTQSGSSQAGSTGASEPVAPDNSGVQHIRVS